MRYVLRCYFVPVRYGFICNTECWILKYYSCLVELFWRSYSHFSLFAFMTYYTFIHSYFLRIVYYYYYRNFCYLWLSIIHLYLECDTYYNVILSLLYADLYVGLLENVEFWNITVVYWNYVPSIVTSKQLPPPVSSASEDLFQDLPQFFVDHQRSHVIYNFGCVCLSVCLSVWHSFRRRKFIFTYPVSRENTGQVCIWRSSRQGEGHRSTNRRNFLFLQCKTSTDDDSASVTH